MPTKQKKPATAKTSTTKVRDLAASKDPKGGAQKKETQGTGDRSRGILSRGKSKIS